MARDCALPQGVGSHGGAGRLVATVEIHESAWTLVNPSYTGKLNPFIPEERSTSSDRHREQPERRHNRSTALGESELTAVYLEREPHDQTERHRGCGDIRTESQQTCSMLSMCGQNRPRTHGCGGRDHRESVGPGVAVKRNRKGRNRQGRDTSPGERKAPATPCRAQPESGAQVADATAAIAAVITHGSAASRAAKALMVSRRES